METLSRMVLINKIWIYKFTIYTVTWIRKLKIYIASILLPYECSFLSCDTNMKICVIWHFFLKKLPSSTILSLAQNQIKAIFFVLTLKTYSRSETISCSWKPFKNDFYFVFKVLFCLKVFKVLSWIFGKVRK